MAFAKLAAEIWRAFVTDGVPASGVNPPNKADVLAWGTEVESRLPTITPIPNTVLTDVYFKSGKPWADVRAYGAVGNSTTDDTAAIQAAINDMRNNYGGGTVYFPPGSYLVSGGGLLVKGGVQLLGAATNCTSIFVNSDSQVITFDAATAAIFAAIQNLFIVGYQNVSATTDAVTIGANVPAILRDCYIWFGRNGLLTQGVDGIVDNCFISGYNDAVLSSGANWYIRCKLDTAGITSANAFVQNNAGFLAENHFTQCDFSGSYTNSLVIDDSSTNSAVSHFDGCVFSTPILLNHHKWTGFSGCEFGSTTLASNNNLSIVGSVAFSATTITGTGAKSLAGNFNIS